MKLEVGDLVKRNRDSQDWKIDVSEDMFNIVGNIVAVEIDDIIPTSDSELYFYVEWSDGKKFTYKSHELIKLTEPNKALKEIL